MELIRLLSEFWVMLLEVAIGDILPNLLNVLFECVEIRLHFRALFTAGFAMLRPLPATNTIAIVNSNASSPLISSAFFIIDAAIANMITSMLTCHSVTHFIFNPPHR